MKNIESAMFHGSNLPPGDYMELDLKLARKSCQRKIDEDHSLSDSAYHKKKQDINKNYLRFTREVENRHN